MKDGHLHLLRKPHYNIHTISKLQEGPHGNFYFSKISLLPVSCLTPNSSSLHLPCFRIRKTRGNFTYFHVLAAGVAEEELAGWQGYWGWLGSAGPEDSAGPWGSASLSWALRLGCSSLKWEPKQQRWSGRHCLRARGGQRQTLFASSGDSRLCLFQFLLDFKTEA